VEDSLCFQLAQDPKSRLNYKELERTRFFICHLSMTFELITPFLKGFHLTILGQLPRRNSEGWKIAERSWDAYIHQQVAEGLMKEEDATEALNPPDSIGGHLGSQVGVGPQGASTNTQCRTSSRGDDPGAEGLQRHLRIWRRLGQGIWKHGHVARRDQIPD
jgi:hypothetical protein